MCNSRNSKPRRGTQGQLSSMYLLFSLPKFEEHLPPPMSPPLPKLCETWGPCIRISNLIHMDLTSALMYLFQIVDNSSCSFFFFLCFFFNFFPQVKCQCNSHLPTWSLLLALKLAWIFFFLRTGTYLNFIALLWFHGDNVISFPGGQGPCSPLLLTFL